VNRKLINKNNRMRDGEFYYVFQQHDYGYILNKHKIYNGSVLDALQVSIDIRKLCLQLKKEQITEVKI
jgi:hypothetical protein